MIYVSNQIELSRPRHVPQLGRQLEEKSGLPHLAWAGDELDACGRGLGQPAAERLPTAREVETRRLARPRSTPKSGQ
jgi:hypothetical protein